MDIENLIEPVRKNFIRITDHADEEAASDRLSYEAVLITVYRPDPEKWINWTLRKKSP